MEMHQVRYFVALCETLNFTRAAEVCHVAQPSLTKAIQKLEEELGGPLFSRERSLTHLTDLGRLMRPHLEGVYEASQLAQLEAKNFQKMERGSIRLGAMCTIGPSRLIGFLKRFSREVPSVTVSIEDSSGTQVANQLLEGNLDVALLGIPELPERVDGIPLYTEKYVVAFYPGHRFESMDTVPLRELNAENYVTRTNCEYPDHFMTLGIPDPANVTVCYESEREDWVQAMILAGMGCSVVPEYLPTMPGIGTRPLVEPELTRTIKLATVAGRRYSPGLRAMVAMAKNHDWMSF